MASFHVTFAIFLIAGLFTGTATSQNYFNASYDYVAGTNNTVIETYGSNDSLPAIYTVAYGPGATGVRVIPTPWPIIAGQSVLSVVLYLYGSKKSGKSWIPEYISFGFKFMLNSIRCVGAIIYLTIYIAHGGAYPNIGIVLMFESFMILSYPLKQESRDAMIYMFIAKKNYVRLLWVAVSIVGIGGALFVTCGLLEVVRKRAHIPAVVLDVTRGCPSGTFYPNGTSYQGAAPVCSQPGPHTYSLTPGFSTTTLAWWGVGSLLCFANFFLIYKVLNRSGEHFVRQATTYKKIGLYVMVVGVFIAIGTAGGSALGLTESYYDCSNATQQSDGNWTGCVLEHIAWPGSASGFWNVWTKSHVAVLQGIFAW